MTPSMIPGQSGPRTILSVFPLTMISEPLRHEGVRTYTIEGAKKGSYSTLTVRDTYAWNRDYNADEFRLFQAPIPGDVVAENLVNRWSEGMIGTKEGLGPGIQICRGSVPTAEEVADATARQEAYFRFLIYQADEQFQKEGGLNITNLHRVAAEWMGLNDRQWIKPIVSVDLALCPACAESIKASAIICRHCHTNIEDFNEARAAKLAAKAQAQNPMPPPNPGKAVGLKGNPARPVAANRTQTPDLEIVSVK